MPDTQPIWEQQPNEPARWFARFEMFRLAGPMRSIDSTYRVEKGLKGTAPGHWKRAAVNWKWRERAEAWDAFEREGVRQRRAADLDRIYTEQFETASSLMVKVKDGVAKINTDLLSPSELARLFELAVTIQRDALERPLAPSSQARLEDLLRTLDERNRAAAEPGNR